MENMADNAVVEAVEQGAEPVAQTTPEGSAAAAEASPAPESNETQRYSRNLNRMLDNEIKGLGLVNPYTDTPIETAAQLKEYRKMQEAEADGQDPVTAAALLSLREELSSYRQREQLEAIKADPALSKVYADYRDDVEGLIEFARQSGQEVNYEAAVKAVIANNYSDLQSREAERIRKETLGGIASRSLASSGSIGGAPVGNEPDYSGMSDSDFEKLIAAAKRGQLKKS